MIAENVIVYVRRVNMIVLEKYSNIYKYFLQPHDLSFSEGNNYFPGVTPA